MLVINKIRSGYSGSEVLHGIDMKVPDERITLLTGPNGAGKSTLLRTVVGLTQANAGNVEYNGNDITKMKTGDRIRLGIAYVPGGRVFPGMTVSENLKMGGYLIKDRVEVRRRMQETLDLFPVLRERINQKAGFLSGGERQMLVLARSLIPSPQLILLDEPSTGLDIGKQELIFSKLKELNQKGIAILLVEQNVRQSAKISDYMYFMTGGNIKFEGEPATLIEQSAGMGDIFFKKL